MKKLSALLALILCVTIGGVYATWQYANTDAKIEHDVMLAVGMDYETTGSAGEFKIEVADSLTPLKVEPATDGSYTATLVAPAKIYLTFTPSANSTDEIIANGIDAYMYFTDAAGIADYKYDGTQIFTYEKGNGATNAVKIGKIGTDESDTTVEGVFSKMTVGGVEKIACDITSLLVDEMIKIGTFTLPTFDDYTAFKNSLTYNGKALTFSLHLTNVNPNA